MENLPLNHKKYKLYNSPGNFAVLGMVPAYPMT